MRADTRPPETHPAETVLAELRAALATAEYHLAEMPSDAAEVEVTRLQGLVRCAEGRA
jgi:hypothetical protein